MKAKSKTKSLVTFVLSVCLLTSVFLTAESILNLNGIPPVSAEPHFLNLVISPSQVKLHVNESQTFTVFCNNSIGVLSYEWSTSNDSLIETVYSLVADNENATFQFLQAYDEILKLNCLVTDTFTDSWGIIRHAQMSISADVYDPYSTPDLYLDATVATASYIIDADGLGWYRMVNGSTMQSVMTSTNANSVLANAVGNSSNGDTIFIKGNINCTAPFVISKQIRLTGQNRHESSLIFTGTNGINITVTQVTIDNLGIIENGFTRTYTGILFNGSASSAKGYSSLSNLYLWGWNTALKLQYTVQSTFDSIDTTFSYTALDIWGQCMENKFVNCAFINYGTTQYTVVFRMDSATALRPEGNSIMNSVIYKGNWSVALIYSNYNLIQGNTIDSYSLYGIHVCTTVDTRIIDNLIESTTSGAIGITLSDSAGNQTIIANNWLQNPYVNIWLLGSNQFNTIQGNIFRGVNSTGTDVVLTNTNNGYNIISNNQFLSLSACSIIEVGSSNYNVIIGNICPSSTYGILTVGANTKVNHCWNGTSWIS